MVNGQRLFRRIDSKIALLSFEKIKQKNKINRMAFVDLLM